MKFGIPLAEAHPPRRRLRQRQTVELWLQRPKRERTAEDVLAFYGWLSDHRAILVPSGPDPIRQLRAILREHILESA